MLENSSQGDSWYFYLGVECDIRPLAPVSASIVETGAKIQRSSTCLTLWLFHVGRGWPPGVPVAQQTSHEFFQKKRKHGWAVGSGAQHQRASGPGVSCQGALGAAQSSCLPFCTLRDAGSLWACKLPLLETKLFLLEKGVPERELGATTTSLGSQPATCSPGSVLCPSTF